jgi:hypothetical protein
MLHSRHFGAIFWGVKQIEAFSTTPFDDIRPTASFENFGEIFKRFQEKWLFLPKRLRRNHPRQTRASCRYSGKS